MTVRKRRRVRLLIRRLVGCLGALLVVAGATAQAAPGPVFTVNSLSGLYVRSGPGDDFPPVALLPYLSQVQMECQLRVLPEGEHPQIWDKLESDDPLLDGNWVLDLFVMPTGGNDFNNLVPHCDKPPSGAITHPRAGAEVKPGSRVVVSGRFEDDLGIKSVEYFASSGSVSSWTPIGRAEDRGDGVFTKEWVVDYPLGSTFRLAATITDTGGNVTALTGGVAGIRVSDRDQEPEGAMTSPAPAAAAVYGSPITLSARVTDDGPIGEVAFWVRKGIEEWTEAGVDAEPDGDSYSVEWTATFPTYQPGTLVGFKATVTDAAGHEVDFTGPNNVVVTQLKTERGLSLRIVRLGDGTFGATGKLTVPKDVAGCRRGMVVKIERWDDEEWVRAGRGPAVTNGAGIFTKRLTPAYAATFRAVTEEFTKEDGNQCLGAVSRKTNFGAGKS